MSLSASLLTFDNTTVNQASYASASVEPGANSVLLLGVSYAIESVATPPPPSSISGLGLTWEHIGTEVGSGTTGRGISLYRAQTAASPPAPGSMTIDFAGTQDNAGWALVELTGARLGNNGAEAVGLVDTDTTDGATLNFDLGSTNSNTVTLVFANSNSSVAYSGTGTELGASTVINPTVQWAVRYSAAGEGTWSITTGTLTRKAGIGVRVLGQPVAEGGYTLAEWDGSQLVPLTVAEWDGDSLVPLDIERHT